MHFAHASSALMAASLLASAAHAHVILEQPRPYKFAAYGHSNPIVPDGSDFPCKVPPGATLELDGEPTVMTVGEDQVLSFIGLAVHGGGSCQLSITRDFPPTRDSVFRVFHSIEGGCPARNVPGNLDRPNDNKYIFRIPEGIELGGYTLAWTWVARIGGLPEFYMNCSPIRIVSPATSSRQRSRVDSRSRKDLVSVSGRAFETDALPEMWMANMGDVSGGCTTDEARNLQVAIRYPNPGPSVDRPEGDADLFPQACDGNPRASFGSAPSPVRTSGPVPAPVPQETAPQQPGPVLASSPAPVPAPPRETTPQQPGPDPSPVSDSNPVQPPIPAPAPVPPTETTPPQPGPVPSSASVPGPVPSFSPATALAPPMEATPPQPGTVTSSGSAPAPSEEAAPPQPTEPAAPFQPLAEPSAVIPATAIVTLAVTVNAAEFGLPSSTQATEAPPPGEENKEEEKAKEGSCTEGYLTCLPDGKHFATCTGGRLAYPRPLGEVSCIPGEGEGLDIVSQWAPERLD